MSDKDRKDPKIFGVDVGLMLLTLIENIRKIACFRCVQIVAPIFLISFVASCEDARTREIRKSAISEIERVELETVKYHYRWTQWSVLLAATHAGAGQQVVKRNIAALEWGILKSPLKRDKAS